MRDRLIKLIEEFNREPEKHCPSSSDSGNCDICEYNIDGVSCMAMRRAEYLLKNGVIVPPCKVGDIAYQHIYHKNGYSHTLKEKVVGVHIIDAPGRYGHTRENYIITYNDTTNSVRHIRFSKIGKTAFLTEEEAEQALRKEDEKCEK